MTFDLSRYAGPALRSLIMASALTLAACGKGDDGDAQAASAEVQEAEATDGAQEEASTELIPAPEGSQAANEMAMGSEDAILTITEFASVTCPGCAGFHSNIFPAIKKELIDTGQVRFVYKEFPTPPVRLSQAGFILARCAATEQGSDAYFAMIEALYKTQRMWIGSENPGDELRNIAAQAGLVDDEFENCFVREDIRDAIIANIEEGKELGLVGTPSFVVDGEKFEIRGNAQQVVEMIKEEIEKRS
ncbi:MAG: DsbA family protein [Pseudomonadota bacterium]